MGGPGTTHPHGQSPVPIQYVPFAQCWGRRSTAAQGSAGQRRAGLLGGRAPPQGTMISGLYPSPGCIRTTSSLFNVNRQSTDDALAPLWSDEVAFALGVQRSLTADKICLWADRTARGAC